MLNSRTLYIVVFFLLAIVAICAVFIPRTSNETVTVQNNFSESFFPYLTLITKTLVPKIVPESNSLSPVLVPRQFQAATVAAPNDATDQRFIGLLAHVKWLIKNQNSVLANSGIDKINKQFESLADNVGDSSNNVRDSLTDSGSFANSTLTLPVFDGPIASNLSLGSYYLSGDGGNEGLLIDSLGNVSIGTSTVSAAFNLDGEAYLSQVSAPATTTDKLYNLSGSLYWAGNLVGGASVGTWTTDGTHAWRASGNVGIGTTTPTAKLDVQGSAEFGTDNVALITTTGKITGLSSTYFGTDTSANLATILTDESGTGNAVFSISPTITGTADFEAGDFSSTLTLSGTAANIALGSNYISGDGDDEGVYVDVSGNVGIGTSSPSQALSVQGSGLFSGNLSAANLTATGTLNVVGQTTLDSSLTGFVQAVSGVLSATALTSGQVTTALGFTPGTITDIGVTTANGVSGTSSGGTTANLTIALSDITPTTVNGTYLSLGQGSISTNIALGSGVLSSVSLTGGYNAATGYEALKNNTSGSQNTATGYQTLYTNTQGGANAATGYQALKNNTYGNYNTANGAQALFANNTGSNNTATGYQALLTNNAYNNTATGYQTLKNNTGSSNTATGYRALTANTQGANNTATGYGTLSNNTQGGNNTATGYGALLYNNTGSSNAATGFSALYNNTTGSNNTAAGFQVLLYNTTGSNNTVFGYQALYRNSSATSTVAIGAKTGYGGAGYYNNQGGTYVGYQSGYLAGNSSDYNTLLGYQSGYDITTGANNLVLGTEQTTGSGITSGSNNILLGKGVRYGLDGTASNQLNIGNLIFATGLGSENTFSTGNVGIGTTTPVQKLQVFGDIRVGNTGSNGCIEDYGGGIIGGTCSSDKRLKENISPLVEGEGNYAERLSALTTVTYNWNRKASDLYSKNIDIENLGLIAQDVEAVFPELITYNKEGYRQVDFRALPFYMLEAIKELWNKVSGHDKRIQNLEEENKLLKERLSDIEDKLNIDVPESVSAPAPPSVEEETAVETEEGVKEVAEPVVEDIVKATLEEFVETESETSKSTPEEEIVVETPSEEPVVEDVLEVEPVDPVVEEVITITP